ncbi:unnamed protein product [Bemisia tabaci]|uniref:G-protein coupled receptors family 1 profile domain-containing protein n=1 Tax=Bemisia tabaci TaxID=7038 RepID=A0A9P0EZC6_BEMTA|nr:unnamed protein product [Bemisia tabaci]
MKIRFHDMPFRPTFCEEKSLDTVDIGVSTVFDFGSTTQWRVVGPHCVARLQTRCCEEVDLCIARPASRGVKARREAAAAFLAIWWPLKCQITTRRARIIITGIWLVSIATTLPWALYFDLVIVFEDVPEIQVCLEKWPNPLVGLLYFLIVNLFFSYLLPMAIITASYILIWVRVGKRNIPTDAKDAALERMQQKSKMKVIKMLVAVVILFAFSWLPLYIIFGWIKVTGETGTELLQTLTPIAQWLGASNSCINPILYACFNKKFRKGFMELIRSWKICAPLRKYETVAMASSSTSTRKGSALGPHGAVLRRQTTHDSCYITSSAALRRQTSQETYLVNDDGRILPRQASQDSSTFGSERGGILKRQTSNDSNSMRVSKPISTVVGVLARAGSGDSSTSRTRFSTKTDSISEEATGDFTADLDGFTTSVSNSVDIEDITPEQIDAITNANTNANALTAMEFETSVVNGFIPAGSISKAPLVQVHSFPRAKGIPRMAPRRQMSHETRVSFMYECTRV